MQRISRVCIKIRAHKTHSKNSSKEFRDLAQSNSDGTIHRSEDDLNRLANKSIDSCDCFADKGYDVLKDRSDYTRCRVVCINEA